MEREIREKTLPLSCVRKVIPATDSPRMYAELDSIQQLVLAETGRKSKLNTLDLKKLLGHHYVVQPGVGVLGVYVSHSTERPKGSEVTFAHLKFKPLDEHTKSILEKAFAKWRSRGDAPQKPLEKK